MIDGDLKLIETALYARGERITIKGRRDEVSNVALPGGYLLEQDTMEGSYMPALCHVYIFVASPLIPVSFTRAIVFVQEGLHDESGYRPWCSLRV